MLYSTSPLYGYQSGVWKLMKNFSASSIVSMYAIDENNLFVAGTQDALFQFNGLDWYEYPKLFNGKNQVDYTALWANGNEIFIVGNSYGNPMQTIILHGK